jgi:hypothetical protein
MLTVMLGFQTYHQWSEHLWEHHAEDERDQHDCDLCDWNLQAFLKPVDWGEWATFFTPDDDFQVVFSEGFQNQFFGSHCGRGPPEGEWFAHL